MERLAKEFNMSLYRTSVKEDLNVDEVFKHLAEDYVHKVKSFNDMEANVGYPVNNHESQLHHGTMSHLGNVLGLKAYGTNSSARQLIQIGASSTSITRPYNHNTQHVIGVGAPRTNSYYKRNNTHRSNNGYTGGIGGYNAEGYSSNTYSSTNGLPTGRRSNDNR